MTARRRAAVAAALGVVMLAVLGYAAFEFAGRVGGATAGGGPPGGLQQAAAAASVMLPGAPSPHATATTPAVATASASAAAASRASASPRASTAPPEQTLAPVSAVAFGPDGTSDGDNPQIAARVLTDPAQGWMSLWYATPDFGSLKQGTGLLLDLGRTVTIAAVRVTLGSPPGSELQLRLGAAPDLGALPVVTTAAATSDQLRLRLPGAAKDRYVLLWFTRLPPDGAGTYQAFVHGVTVQGQP